MKRKPKESARYVRKGSGHGNVRKKERKKERKKPRKKPRKKGRRKKSGRTREIIRQKY